MVDNSGSSNTSFQGVAGQPAPSGAAGNTPPPPAYRASFSPSPAAQYPAQTAFTPQPPAPAPTPEPEDPEETRQFWNTGRMERRTRLLVLAGIVAALLAVAGVAAFLFWQASRQETPQNPVSSAISFDVQQLSLSELTAGTLPPLQGARKMSINGQLEVSNGLIIAPSGQPTGAVAGQLYYDQGANVLNYFNGSEFVAVANSGDIVSDVGGVSGSITVGAGLSTNGGQLSNLGVLNVQTVGPVVSSGGQNPTVGLANGTAAGEFWQWDGDSWELATAASTAEADGVVGNEVTEVITGAGLILRGSATAADPLRVGLEACGLNEVLKSNGSGGWACAPDAGGTSYSAGNGLNLDGSGQFSVNSPTCAGTTKLQWNGTAFVCAADVDTDTNTTYSAGTGLSLTGTTFNNTGTLSVTASGAITSSGGQTPNLAFANGTLSGQFWQWNGSAWVLALLPSEQDSVVGNEVTDATASQGLARSGSGTALDPFTLGLQSCTNGQVLKSNGSAWVCAADDSGSGGTTYGADGQGIELTGTTFSLELDSTSLSKSATGLRLNTANANTWAASQTFGAGLVVSAGQSVTLNGDVVTDMTGSGLTVAGGALQTTLGTSVDLGSEVVGTLPIGNGGTGLTALGTAHQLLGVNSDGTALAYQDLGTLIAGGSGISVSGTNVVTISNSGVLSVAGSGPITSTGGQTPTITFANGTASGQFWQWNGSAWALASLPAEQDAVVGNEVVGGTGTNSGLTRSGTGTAGNPYTLSVTTGNGLQVSSNAVGINSPTCSGTDKLQWNGTAFVCTADVDTDTNTTYSALSSGGLRLVGTQFGLTVCASGEVLKATAVSGEYACAADNDTDTNTTYSADGQGIELSGTTFSLELNGAGLSKSASGLSLNVANANTWSALQTFGAGATVSAGQALTVNGDAFTDLTGTGLTINTGSLQTTLGTSVDLTSEVVGTLPVSNGGTGLTALGTSNQLLGVNSGGTALEYKNLSSLLVAGSGIGLSGTNTVTVSNSGVLSVAGSGPITSTGGQNPTLTFADGVTSGDFWQWDGDSWELASLPAEQDAVVGNEVTGVTGANSGLVRSGAGTGVSPYTLAVNPGNGLQVTSNALGINSPTCSGTDKLQWNGTAFVCAADQDSDTNTTYSTITNGGLRLVGTQFGLTVCASGEVLKATAVSGEYACASDDGGTSYTADGQGIELSGTTFSLELNGTGLAKGASGLSLNVANANTWSALQTFGAGATISAGQALTVNGDAFTDLTGTGLTINTGSLQTTLGTSVDLTTEVVGTLPVSNGGTGLTALGTSNQLLGVNSGGTALEYKNLSSLLVAGSGVGLSGTDTVTVSNSGVLSIAGSGPITSTGGQNPTLTFANGTTAGDFWQWDGDSWELASLPAEQDAVVGNEVTNVTGSNSGLVRSGSGTNVSPYTLAVNPGNGLQISTNALGIDSPACSGTDKLQWNGAAFVCSADVDTDTNTTYSVISNGGLRLSGTQFGLSVCTEDQILKATAVSGEYACAADTDTDTTYTADGQGIELTGTTFGLELNGTSLSKSASGLSINLANANSWSGLQTFAAGATVSAGQALTVNGDAITDLTGNGLSVATGVLGINSPTCSGTDKLQWTGSAFTCAADVDTDTNTTYSVISNGGLRLVGTQFGLSVCTQNQILKATAVSGEYACAADADTNTTYTADGQGIELTGTTFGLELNGTTLSKSASGLNLNLGNANTWTALQTYNAGALIAAGQALTLNGEAFTDLTGTGLSISAGVLQTTLGTTVDLAAEVTGTLPIANGGTGATTAQGAINALSGLTTNGDLLYHNGTNATRLARGSNGQCLTSNATTIAWGSCGATVDLQTAYDASPTGTTPEIALNATQGALQVRRDSGGTLTDLLYVQDSTGSTNYFTAHTAGITVTGSVNAGTGSIIGQTFRTADQTAATTSSAESSFTSGQVSGAGSASGQVRVRSGHSTTSGNTGNVRITTGDATSGNSGDVILDVGAASATHGQITIGETLANTIDIGRSSGSNASVELNGTVTAKPVSDVADAFQIQNANGSQLITTSTVAVSNIVANGGMEQTSIAWAAKGTTSGVGRVTTNKFAQTASLEANIGAVGSGVRYNTTLTQNQSYALSFYAKKSSGSGTIQFGYNHANSEINCISTAEAIVSTAWNRYSCVFTTPNTAAAGTPNIYIESATGTGVVWIDNVMLTQTTLEHNSYYEGVLDLSGVAVNAPLTIQNSSDNSATLQLFGGNFYMKDNDSSKSFRIRTDGTSIDIESAGSGTTGDLYINGWTGNNFTGNQVTFLHGSQAGRLLYVGNGGGTSDPTLLVLADKNNSSSDPTGTDGAMYYNSVSDSFRCRQNGQWRSCSSGVVFANTTVPAGNTLTSTSETKYASSYTIPANDCQAGRVYRITAQGHYSTSAANGHLVKVFWGNTDVLGNTSAVNNTVSSAITLGWRLEAQITCVSTTAVEAQGLLTWINSSTGVGAYIEQMVETGTITVTTNSSQALQISNQWSTTGGSSTLRQYIVEVSGP